ncbi:TetR/AcrR family transcriptional regulator [Paraburkholderia sp. C35]|uniref:TetR/AcrR family transcriptional regulator n=1 Tax=Paraburkholderia sp. C35 TaxID=2126993 RepID=UPI000D68AD84|nr:TetR/AcrR family transcriptional regulator [Paraburkholderia sp. C35]
MNPDRKHGPGGRLTRCESQARLRAVVESAKKRFLSDGFRETSLDDIARDAGVAKKTLYGHFGSKEQLFSAILQMLGRTWQEELRRIVTSGGEPVEVLQSAALHLLDIGTREDMTQLYWVLLVETRRFPTLSAGLYQQHGRLIGIEPLVSYLQAAMESGKLEFDDVELAAEQFVHLVLGGVRARMLLMGARRPGPARRRMIATQAVRIFVAGCMSR